MINIVQFLHATRRIKPTKISVLFCAVEEIKREIRLRSVRSN